jgi:hypothetical protein
VNTFHFGQIGDPKPLAPLAPAEAFRNFYTVPGAGRANSIGKYISNEMSRFIGSSKVELYDLEDALPRLPYFTLPFALPSALSATDFPGEVAIVCSWTTADDPAVPVRRRRGRTFIGPLIAAAGALDAGILRPGLALRQDIAASAFALLDSVTEGLVVYSRTSTPDVVTDITGGYVDNAFDTMRSRGADVTSRTAF